MSAWKNPAASENRRAGIISDQLTKQPEKQQIKQLTTWPAKRPVKQRAGHCVRAGSRAAVYLILVVLIVLLGGCSSAVRSSSAGTGDDGAGEKIYLLNADRTLLVECEYEPLSGSLEDMDVVTGISDVLLQLSTPPQDMDCAQPIQDFSILGTSLSGNALTINLSAGYGKLDSTLEILTRAAIVNSLCAIDGVDTVSFLCEGEELTDADGDTVGAMTADMFIVNSGSEIVNYEKVRLHLYFASENGDELVDTYRSVVYNSNISLERLVTEQVLKGPNSDVVYPTLNESTQILSVTTRDYVCYINLDQTFLDDPYSVTPQVAIYSLVNSLTELTSVQKVRILIDGDDSRSFMDTSLSQTFERNLSIVRQTED